MFKGQLSNDVPVAVKILNDKVDAKGSGQDFINEVSTIGLIHHVNVVRWLDIALMAVGEHLFMSFYQTIPWKSLSILEKIVETGSLAGKRWKILL